MLNYIKNLFTPKGIKEPVQKNNEASVADNAPSYKDFSAENETVNDIHSTESTEKKEEDPSGKPVSGEQMHQDASTSDNEDDLSDSHEDAQRKEFNTEKEITESNEEDISLESKKDKSEENTGPSPVTDGNGKTTETKQSSQNNIQLIVFNLGNEEYGVPIELVKEVVITPDIVKMPETPGYMKGVGNIRGNIIAIIDLVERFGINSNSTKEYLSKGNDNSVKYSLVIEGNKNDTIGILLDRVPDSLAITNDNVENNLGIIQDFSLDNNYINGIVKIDNRLIILIDILNIMEKENTQWHTEEFINEMANENK